MSPFVPGQRWLSTAEPELGLGTVLRIEGRAVQVLFAAAKVMRHYAIHSAPLLRAEFGPGQRVCGNAKNFIVERVERRDGLARYHGEGQVLAEGELDDVQGVSQADERLISGRADRNSQFELRVETLERRAALRRLPCYGVMSARVDLIPHQLRVAELAAQRRPPRLLLADEVGLGKTIEAGLILARLLAAARIRRVLILVPGSLVHQWFVELLRRFNLSFSIFDEERCEAIEVADDGRNPFEDDQLVLADTAFLAASPKRADQVRGAGWDMLVVDEAHHLAWTPEAASPEYRLVESLAQATPGTLLLTATPEQLGRAGHFARLRLLDPARFHDLDAFARESDAYVRLSRLADALLAKTPIGASEREWLLPQIAGDAQATQALAEFDKDPNSAGEALVRALIDRHGTGRVMFRNRRAIVGGFQMRVAELVTLPAEALNEEQRQRLLAEFQSDVQQPPVTVALEYNDDPRLPWLLALLDRHSDEKLLLICRTQDKVMALEEALRTRSGVKLARFHEGLGLVQRDRNAAYFADPEGARLLLCSEIGSEGRNFQFAQHLVLWDLPLDPDLLEQRIGRLDRIGQRHPVRIHFAACSGSAQELLGRWLDEGLQAFRSSPSDGRELLKLFGERLVRLALEHAAGDGPDAEAESLIAETRAAHVALAARIEAGRDRLLELATLHAPNSDAWRTTLAAEDRRHDGEEYMLRLFEHYGVQHEELAKGTYLLDPEYLSDPGFPGLKDGAQTITFDRGIALGRDDLPLLRLDHPLVAGAMELMLSAETGNCAFLVDDALAPKSVVLECVFVLECVAAETLHVERFLPNLPIAVALDSKLADRSGYAPSASSRTRAGERPVDVTRYRKFLAALVPPMLRQAEVLAQKRAQTEIATAKATAVATLDAELARLDALARVNPSVRQAELDAIVAERDALAAALPRARLRLDALRFACSVDFLSMR